MKALYVLGVLSVAGLSVAQTIDPVFSGQYSFTDLGSVIDVPVNYGGLTFVAGDPNKILLGGAANGSSGKLYQVPVIRDGAGHITGFSGPGVAVIDAPYNDGGVTYGPGGVLFASRWPVNELGQYKPGSTTPDKIINMGALGVASSHSAVMFGPSGRSYAGRMKVSSYGGGQFYDATYAPDGLGTYDITSVTYIGNLQGGPEGFAYVPLGSPLFGDAMLVSEFGAGVVSTYDVDSLGNPIFSSRRVFMSGLSGAEGAVIDPVTGDFLFSTFGGGNRIIVVKGFAVPEPSAIFALSLGAAVLLRRKRT
ncbi:MAG: PEP-CTERM sorting domain-containing protein [Chthonomonas sp.]|nr:PEP-CTERM sorting domain-containing protein [Chthonomonas sp.]